MRFVEPYPARLPLRLDFLPDRMRLDGITVDAEDAYAIVQFGGPPSRSLDVRVTANPPVNGERQWSGCPDRDWRTTTLGGRPGRCADPVDSVGTRCEAAYGPFHVSVGGDGLGPEVFDRVFAGLHLATVDDPATWFDVTEAIPVCDAGSLPRDRTVVEP